MVISRRKACIACADSKRRCDKQVPECQRCLDRDVDCHYPRPKGRRRRDLVSSLSHARQPQNALPLSLPVQSHAEQSVLGLCDWPPDGNSLDVPFIPDTVIPHDLLPTSLPEPTSLLDPLTNSLPHELLLSSGQLPNIASRPWFLQDETWGRDSFLGKTQHRSTDIELEPFVRAVEGMLKSWVTTGYNHFIHQRLYEKGMPTCIQNAFTTLAAYISCTPAVKEIVLQAVEDRSNELVRQGQFSSPNDDDASTVRTQLARVQALFVYIFIRLFDGSVRARASAERQLPTLQQWLTRMWEVTQLFRGQYRGHGGSYTFQPVAGNNLDDDHYETTAHLWQLWILTESVRRSKLIIDAVANTYECMVKGWAECSGGLTFTARIGLWEADSTETWFGLTCAADTPLLVSSAQPALYISQYAAKDFDDLIKIVWACAIGSDRMRCWINGEGRNRESVL